VIEHAPFLTSFATYGNERNDQVKKIE
jgi:hypothetical protein